MPNSSLTFLAVESSCDETAIAIYNSEKGVLANEIYSQIPLHREYGGVVPELAARDHLRRLPLLLQQALKSGTYSLTDIDIFAYTAGPGLLGALMTGATFAKGLAFAQKKPVMAIHHMEGHLLSPLLCAKEQPEFPFLSLLVSGGHTLLVAVKAIGDYEILGQTLDDAVGESFDKTAKLMGLPYPGGPELAQLAQTGNPKKFKLSRPMTNRPGLDFSFSGLKTQTRLLIESNPNMAEVRADIAASFEQTIIDTILIKCRRAWQQTGYRDLVIAGGVSANKLLRQTLQNEVRNTNRRVFFPEQALSTDNALMIAFAASLQYPRGIDSNLEINVKARWALDNL